MNTLQRLEKWKSGHNARSVSIQIDDGYGASCWTVELYGQGNADHESFGPYEYKPGYVYAAEVSFFLSDKEPPRNYVYVIPNYKEEVDNKDWDWPGLEAVINAAIDRAEELGL